MVRYVVQVTRPGYRCQRCQYIWIPVYQDRPSRCPRCKSTRWDKETAWGVSRGTLRERPTVVDADD